jgi:hypothetical protein
MDHRKITAQIGIDTDNAINETLVEFKARLDALAASIGATEETAEVEIEHERGWDDDSGSVTAIVFRWETDEECVAREAQLAEKRAERERMAVAHREQQERAIYEALKAKFEAGKD